MPLIHIHVQLSGLTSVCFRLSALTTLALIKDMITRPNKDLPGGIPAIIIPDNGVELKIPCMNNSKLLLHHRKLEHQTTNLISSVFFWHIDKEYSAKASWYNLFPILRHEENMTHQAKQTLL